VWRDDQVGVLASGNGYGYGRWQPTRRAASIDDLADGTRVHGIALECLDERLFELGSADGIQELDEALGGVADILVALGRDPQEG
jgi:hypothetical protein